MGPLLVFPYLCRELGQLCTCLSAKASFVAVVTFKPIVFGGLLLGGNNVASCDDVFVVGLFTDDFPEICAVATRGPRLVLGNLDWCCICRDIGRLLGTSEAVHWGITGETSPVVFSMVWFGRVTFTASVCFGLIASGKTTIFVTRIGALCLAGTPSCCLGLLSLVGQYLESSGSPLMQQWQGFGTSFWFGGMFLFSTLFIFCVWWWDRSDLGGNSGCFFFSLDLQFRFLLNFEICWSF